MHLHSFQIFIKHLLFKHYAYMLINIVEKISIASSKLLLKYLVSFRKILMQYNFLLEMNVEEYLVSSTHSSVVISAIPTLYRILQFTRYLFYIWFYVPCNNLL